MGIDVIGWIGCPAQQQMSQMEWLGVLKMQAARDGLDESMKQALDELARDAGPCADCFGAASPCRREVTEPIDEMSERMLFDYFLRQLREPNSPGDQIHRDAVSGASSNEQRQQRDREPFRETLETGAVVDSAQMFDALLANVHGVEAVTAHALFWRGFADFVPQVMVPRSRSLAELTALAPLFEFTFRQALEGAPACDVLFFRSPR